jgi:mannose-6-phosphate isomerase-like protein (cupin superfamily)
MSCIPTRREGKWRHQYHRKVRPVLGAVAAQGRGRAERPGGQAGQGARTFPWHHHDDVEEMFLVWRGRFRVEFRDRIVERGPGELVVVPRGVEHRTAADDEAEVILLESAGVMNTGNVIDEKFTAPIDERI